MIGRSVTIGDPLGVHARAAALLARTAGRFKSSVWLSCHDGRASLTNQLRDMALGIGPGDEVLVLADGIDEDEALEAVAAQLGLRIDPSNG